MSHIHITKNQPKSSITEERLFDIAIQNQIKKKTDLEIMDREGAYIVFGQNANEKVFDQTFLNDFHKKLDSELLAISIPVKNVLLITDGGPFSAMTLNLHTENLYKDNDKEIRISKRPFLVQEGKLCGLLNPRYEEDDNVEEVDESVDTSVNSNKKDNNLGDYNFTHENKKEDHSNLYNELNNRDNTPIKKKKKGLGILGILSIGITLIGLIHNISDHFDRQQKREEKKAQELILPDLPIEQYVTFEDKFSKKQYIDYTKRINIFKSMLEEDDYPIESKTLTLMFKSLDTFGYEIEHYMDSSQYEIIRQEIATFILHTQDSSEFKNRKTWVGKLEKLHTSMDSAIIDYGKDHTLSYFTEE
ncbi:hypothetical protein HHU12_14265 [Flammeovirga aprica JL-4]|uniref:Uncharacterized protein n=2 Tax=Flammeovirga aprica TaxID=29528 RepID=A0A7X9RUV7_9BACT|nr:hypothetical protein [Flammeovirga aprica JL-4]